METTVINGREYFWTEMNLEDLDEFLNFGHRFSFRCNNKDYYIQGLSFDVEEKGRVGFYYIENEAGEYPENKKATNPDEFKALPFIDGKTIIERFYDLRFFDE